MDTAEILTAPAPAPSAMNIAIPTPTLSEDKDIMVEGLPQLSVPCATIKITSKHVLKKAAKKLGVTIHGYSFTSLGSDTAALVTMDVPPHKGNPLMKSQEFYGEWTMFRSEAKESACFAALKYLSQEGLVEVRDTNYCDMKRYKRKFEEERFWASEFYDRMVSLKGQLCAQTNVLLATEQAAVNKPEGVSSAKQHESTPPSTHVGPSGSNSKEKETRSYHTRVRRALLLEK